MCQSLQDSVLDHLQHSTFFVVAVCRGCDDFMDGMICSVGGLVSISLPYWHSQIPWLHQHVLFSKFGHTVHSQCLVLPVGPLYRSIDFWKA